MSGTTNLNIVFYKVEYIGYKVADSLKWITAWFHMFSCIIENVLIPSRCSNSTFTKHLSLLTEPTRYRQTFNIQIQNCLSLSSKPLNLMTGTQSNITSNHFTKHVSSHFTRQQCLIKECRLVNQPENFSNGRSTDHQQRYKTPEKC